jgi:ribosomal protein L29
MLTVQELRKKSLKDLNAELRSARVAAVKAQIPLRMNQDKKAAEGKKKQRYVAQILTVMNEMNKANQAKDEAAPTPAPAEEATTK